MNDTERLDLKKLLNEMDCDNNTETIRQVKHSVQIRDGIRKMEQLKKTYSHVRDNDNEQFIRLCQGECQFLFDNYMDIFARVLKDEIDLNIMTQLLGVLKMIEDGNVDQHEGSVMVGKILKELYLDSAIKRADNLDKEFAGQRIIPVEGKKLSWKEYKMLDVSTTTLRP